MRPAWLAALIAAVALVAVALVTLDEGQEVSRASGFLPCWLTGDSCDGDLPSEDSVQRWRRTGDKNGPCETGGDCDGLPSRERVNRWKRTNEDRQLDDLREAQGIALRNHLPMPQQPKQSRKDEHDLVTPETLQQKLQHKLLQKAVARASAIEKEVSTGKVSHFDARLGKGLIAHGKKATALLTRHPKSEKNLNKIIAEVKKAKEAQAAAKTAQLKAAQLKKQADQSQQDAQRQAKHAKSALDKAKTMESKHKTSLQKLDMSKDQLRYAHNKASEAKSKLIGKQTAHSKAASVQLVERPEPDPWQAMAASPVETPTSLRINLEEDDEAEAEEGDVPSANADDMLKQYAESQQKYAAATQRTEAQAAQLQAALQAIPETEAVQEDAERLLDGAGGALGI